MLKLSGIYKEFGVGTPDRHTVFDNFSLDLSKGDFVTVIGSNGAGKSTLFNLISGTFLQDLGSIVLDGENISYTPEHKRANLIGRIFQDPQAGTAPNLTVEENLSIAYLRSTKRNILKWVSRKDKAYLREKIAALGMGLEDRMNTRIGLLSGGQRQAVTLVMSTLVTPKLLLLDEHTAALDPVTADKVMALTNKVVRENNITTMMITHNITSALQTGNRTLMMDSGHIVLDLHDPERRELTVRDVLDEFARVRGATFDNDRTLL